MRFKDYLPRLFRVAKDGGQESNVTGYWLIEWKPVFSVALLRFDQGSREAFHSHAFHAVSWILRGALRELTLHTTQRGWMYTEGRPLRASLLPVFTGADRMHKVFGIAPRTWVLTFRGPWRETWEEVRKDGRRVTLTHGRREV